jgi:coenzyme Q-binding protein COQ10
MLYTRLPLRITLCGQSPLFTGRRTVFNLAKVAKSLAQSGAHSDSQTYTITKRFQHPQDLVYRLISRVDLYYEFIPYCTSSFITAKDKSGEPTIAGLRVGFQAFDEEFTCELSCAKPEVVVAKSITHSLFHSLETQWKISPIGVDQCIAELNLSYEFKSQLYNQVSSLFAKSVANLMTKSFEKRAFNVVKDPRLCVEYEISSVDK